MSLFVYSRCFSKTGFCPLKKYVAKKADKQMSVSAQWGFREAQVGSSAALLSSVRRREWLLLALPFGLE